MTAYHVLWELVHVFFDAPEVSDMSHHVADVVLLHAGEAITRVRPR